MTVKNINLSTINLSNSHTGLNKENFCSSQSVQSRRYAMEGKVGRHNYSISDKKPQTRLRNVRSMRSSNSISEST